jgi:hypothetical protein
MMQKFRIPLILQALVFLIPLNIYVIGDWIGSGIQTMFFRYHQTNVGNGVIFLNREMGYVLAGIVTGKSAYALAIWGFGVVLICIATLVMIYAYFLEEPAFIRYSAFLNAGGALLFTVAVVIQYGIFLHGPAGIAIPFGIPVILGIAYLQYPGSPVIPDDKEAEEWTDELP